MATTKPFEEDPEPPPQPPMEGDAGTMSGPPTGDSEQRDPHPGGSAGDG